MRFRTLFNALKDNGVRTPIRHARSKPPRPLAIEALEDRAVPASFSISDVSIIEGNAGTKYAQLTVSVEGAHSPSVSVGYATAGASAVSGSDYQAVSGTLTFGKNVTSKTIQVPIYGDTDVETDQSFFVNLRNPKKATIADGQGVVTILNDDTRISIGDVWLSEGNSGPTNYNFSVNLSNVLNEPVTVSYATADGTALAGSDYVAGSGTVTIPAGQTSGTITVLVNGDSVSELDEHFYVNLSNPTVGTIVDGQGFGQIYDDEPKIYIDGASVLEGNAGTTEINFTVWLSSASEVPVTVDFVSADSLASSADGDYVAASGTVTFAPGETSQTITVQVNGDLIVEPDEDFYVNLSNPDNAQLGNFVGWGNIQSDDNAVLHIDSYWDYEPDPYYGDWGTFYFTVWLSVPSTETVTVDFSTADGSAVDGYDYLGSWGTLTFAPGETSQTISVTVLPDYEYEGDEEFYVVLSNLSSNALFQPGWEIGYGTIFDNQGDYWW